MFKGKKSTLDKVLVSLSDYKSLCRKVFEAQSKAFKLIDLWALEEDKAKIHDVTSQLSSFYTNLEENSYGVKDESLELTLELFDKFRGYDKILKQCDQNVVIFFNILFNKTAY